MPIGVPHHFFISEVMAKLSASCAYVLRMAFSFCVACGLGRTCAAAKLGRTCLKKAWLRLHQKRATAYPIDPKNEASLTHSFERCYVPEVALLAGVAKLAYAADSKSSVCVFCPLRNSSNLLDPTKENDPESLKPFAGILSHFEAF